MSALTIGIDLGGTKIAAAVVDASGGIVGRVARTATPAREGPGAIVAAMVALVDELRAEHPTVEAIGIGAAGVISRDGVVTSATDILPGWAGTPVTALMAAATRLPVTTVNDVHAAALAEGVHGAGSTFDRVLVAAVGTGIGGGVVVAGRLDPGSRGLAGSIGHIPITAASGLRCSCGAIGHVEAAASGPALERRYAERSRSSSLISLRELAARAADGEELAASVIRFGGEALGEALAGAVNLLDIDAVVVGGGVASIGEPLLAPAREAMRAGVLHAARNVPVLAARFGAEAAIVGASLAARG